MPLRKKIGSFSSRKITTDEMNFFSECQSSPLVSSHRDGPLLQQAAVGSPIDLNRGAGDVARPR